MRSGLERPDHLDAKEALAARNEKSAQSGQFDSEVALAEPGLAADLFGGVVELTREVRVAWWDTRGIDQDTM